MWLYSWAYVKEASKEWRQLVGLRTEIFKHFTGCLASLRLSLMSTMLSTYTALLTHYASTDGRTGNEHGSLMLLRAGKREYRV